MHKSLTPQFNIILLTIWFGVLALSLYFGWPHVSGIAGITFVAGMAAGTLQARALVNSAEKFRISETARQIRSTLVSTRPGKYAILLLWGTVIGVVIWVVVTKPNNPIIFLFSAYAAFALARELFSLKATFILARSQ